MAHYNDKSYYELSCMKAGLQEFNRIFENALHTVEAREMCPSEKRACHNTGMSLAALKALCTRDNPLTANDRSDRNAMRLLPGEVGLTHERATFDFRDQRGPNRPVPVSAEHGGTVYYNVRPPTPPIDSTDDEQLRKHVVQMLPTASVKPVVGPVTGLPVGEDEHVLVFRFDKKPGEPDEKARLQIEVRTPKRKLILRKDASTQCNLSAVKTTDRAGSKKKKKKKKEEKTKSADKKKSGAKKKK